MNEANEKLASELASHADDPGFVGYHEIDYRGESWPLDDAGINALPEDVVYGSREATDEEKRAALREQGYELADDEGGKAGA
jgi:hypothetical protein